MKKIYISPNINVTEIKASQMICASNGTLDMNQSITTSDGFGSRSGGSFWDDEEYE